MNACKHLYNTQQQKIGIIKAFFTEIIATYSTHVKQSYQYHQKEHLMYKRFAQLCASILKSIKTCRYP